MIRGAASTNDRPPARHLFIKRGTTHELSHALGVIRMTVALVIAGVLGLAGCSDAQHVVLGECGNRIVEDGEDCDGATGCNNACRFSCRETPDCPSGWGCDVAAGICRVSQGTFRAASLAADRYSSLLVADFDQDGRDDLLSFDSGAGELTTVYQFGPDGALARTIALPGASAATAADMTGDRAPDVVLVGEGATAFRSAGARGFSPLVGALRRIAGTSAKLVAADLDCDGLRDLLLFGGDPASPGTISRVGYGGELTAVSGPLAVTAPQLLALENADLGLSSEPRELVATGTFARAGRRPCEMLALPAPPGTHAVDVYASPDEGQSVVTTARVTYAGDDLPTRWLFADVDGDGVDDLVIAGAAEQQVSHGLGGGRFEPRASPLAADGEILAVGELDGNPGADLFTGLGFGAPYRQARILDLTGDGLADVAAVGDAERLDVLRGSKTGHQSRLPIPTRGVPRIAGAADFDGDGADDLLLGATDGAGGPRRRASIVFAPVRGDGAAAAEVASFGSIAQLAAGFWVPDALNADASADIGVLFSTKAGETQLAFLEGSADRLLRSRLPTGQPTSFGDTQGQPALGRFHAGVGLELAIVFGALPPDWPPSIDVLAIGADGISYSRTVALDGVEVQRPSAIGRPGVLALNLDGDDLDELYVTSSHGLMKVVADGEGFAASSFVTTDSLVAVAAQDADGDGLPDLLVIDRDHGLSVFLARRNQSPEQHVFAAAAFGCDQLGPDLAFIQADSDPARELVFNCYPNGVQADVGLLPSAEELAQLGVETWILDVDLGKNTVSRASVVGTTLTSRFVTGDFNGDGVEDVAGSAPDLVVLFGNPR
jgi:hypothetical protein